MEFWHSMTDGSIFFLCQPLFSVLTRLVVMSIALISSYVKSSILLIAENSSATRFLAVKVYFFYFLRRFFFISASFWSFENSGYDCNVDFPSFYNLLLRSFALNSFFSYSAYFSSSIYSSDTSSSFTKESSNIARKRLRRIKLPMKIQLT